VNAFPLQLSPRPMAPRRLLGGMAVAAVVVLSIWLLVAAGLQRGELGGGAVPGPLPQAPSTIGVELSGPGIDDGRAPLPGPEIAPVDGRLSPR
jgi:hypothetical protein